ncbi:exopolysaccharide biosynthesis protein [Alteromonas sp. ASW11-19]|uniref:Exopolysaccharide biosynthesis protein n=1 Tax=Alteromonas salexigens TaxID=2982530 RepID=A0ABT2VNF3_9ALTE|nr:exopolysaccharide biosynthesis protein [Alteromonas salexigens]MCU7554423.1 exopolysaccharide biosynthesis protein [Alteromonas salexigens]
MANERISSLLVKLKEDTDGKNASVGEVVEAFEHRGFGPLLLIPALIAMLPTGAIPGVPSICGITLFLICIQIAFGKDHPWLPDSLRERSISRDKLTQAVDKAKPYVERVEKVFTPRLTPITKGLVVRFIAIYCGVVALTMIPLEALPFAVMLPAFAIVLTAIGLTTRDGIMVILGLILQASTAFLLMKVMPGG